MKEPDFEEKVKISFLKVKEDINSLRIQIQELNKLILEKEEIINRLSDKVMNFEPKTGKEVLFEEMHVNDSIGNKGVGAINQSINQSINQHKIQVSGRSPLDNLKSVDKLFSSLSRREFLIFLTIYQLNDDVGPITYEDLSKHMNLTANSIRGRVSELIRKNIPIIKSKVNNKITLLSISNEFKDLNLKTRLINLYNHHDPFQKKLI